MKKPRTGSTGDNGSEALGSTANHQTRETMTALVSLTAWAWALGLVGLAVAGLVYVYVKGQDAGSDQMLELADQIHDGAMAFLRREYTVLAIFVVVVAMTLVSDARSKMESVVISAASAS